MSSQLAYEKNDFLKQINSFGEAAIAEFFAHLDEKIAPLEPVLILFEDSDVRRINAFIQGNAHLLSTKALLVGMEQCHLIESAEAIWQSILNIGRNPSDKIIEQPSPQSLGGSYWQPIVTTKNMSSPGGLGSLPLT